MTGTGKKVNHEALFNILHKTKIHCIHYIHTTHNDYYYD